MKYLFFTIFLLIFLAGNYYVFYRAWTVIPLNTVTRSLLIGAAIILVGSIFLLFLAGEHFPVGLTSVFYAIGTSWIFIFLYFLIFNVLTDIIRASHLVPRETFNQYTKDNWLSFGLITGFIALLMLCGYLKYRIKERIDLPIEINKTIGTGDSLTIVALSDMHLGYGIGKSELQQWVELINKENPDVVLIAGDIIDSSVRPLIAQNMSDDLKNIKSKYGVYTVLGNHEYISGASAAAKFIEESNIKLIRDSAVLIDSMFYVVGRDDKTNPNRKSLTALTASLDKSKPIILLDHQPFNLEEAEKNGVDIQFSGHTHRGQVWPISLITDMIYEDSYGYIKKGNTNIYVSSGMGIWGGKFRIGTQSEYVVIKVKTK